MTARRQKDVRLMYPFHFVEWKGIHLTDTDRRDAIGVGRHE